MDDFVKMVEATLKDDRDRFFNFLSLVKRMREAQKKFGGEVDVCIGFEEGLDEMYKLEDKVDELLKKMEI